MFKYYFNDQTKIKWIQNESISKSNIDYDFSNSFAYNINNNLLLSLYKIKLEIIDKSFGKQNNRKTLIRRTEIHTKIANEQ